MSSLPEQMFPEVWKKLCNARLSNRLGHAYCLVGDDPKLLEAFGKRWAQVCACRNPTSQGDACGACKVCKQLDKGMCPEFFELRPQSKSRRILVDEVRDFEHSIQMVTAKGQTKVGMIAEADRLVVQAQNAFLKTLEEPPRNVVLILLTTQPRSLLPTIRSRCQMISVRTNRKQYDSAAVEGVFPVLAKMRRGAGSDVALACAQQLRRHFATLQEIAAQNIDDGLAEGVAAEVEQDNQLQKRLDKVQEARVSAEYLRLRQEVVEAIQVWFMQQSLLAHGAPETYIPNPEVFEKAKFENATARKMKPAEAEQNVFYTEELGRDFAGNIDERLALESFCLMICQHISN
ncbi:MAG: AAA family ATPase [Lentisphaeria bacterium]